MNRRPPGLQLGECLVGFLHYKSAEGLADRTLESYEQILGKWIEYAGDIPVSDISTHDLLAYLNWLRTEYRPQRLNGDTAPLSKKSIRNVWTALSAFFRWAHLEFSIPNPMKSIPAPRFEKAHVEPFTKEDVEALLQVCEYSRKAETVDRRRFRMRRPSAKRDRAILLVLLDTGLRNSELCALTVADVDQKTGRIDIKHRTGGAKGGRGRTVFLGKTARRALWRYLAEREDGKVPDAPLFTARYDRPMNRDTLRQLVRALGRRASIKNCHPHRFRHTFAITYLRAGGDVFTLQALLGHSTLDMVRYYARIAEMDIQQAHRRASPADSWRL